MYNILDLIIELLGGLRFTLLVFIVTLIGSLPLGILIALGRLSNFSTINKLLQSFIYLIRGTPLLLQIVFIYYGLPSVGITFDRLTSVYIAFIINYSAYFGEIFRGGIQSIDKGQYEASKVLGLSRINTFKFIIFPQVNKRTLPSVSNEIITLIKDTALVHIVSITELLRTAQGQANRYATLLPFVLAGIIYLIITAIVTKILLIAEKRYAYYE